MRPTGNQREPSNTSAPRFVMRLVRVGLALVLLLSLAAASVAAAESTSPAAPSIDSGFDAGKVVWWLLLGLSVVALMILFEGLSAVRRARIVPEATAQALAAAVKSRAYGDALRLGEEPAHDSLLSRVVISGVRLARDEPDATPDEIRSSCRDEGEALACRLYRRAEVLGTLGAVAPLFGLLGTTLTLAASLGRIAAAGDSARAADIAAAAGNALGTTVLGLLIALPCLVAANLLRARMDSLMHEAGRRAEEIVRPLGRH
jgi:biopolymer transport protein ExbB